jgi:O-succinylbenzoate synthase
VSVFGGGLVGHAESVARPGPYYSPETMGTVWHLLSDFLIPAVLGAEIGHPREVADLFANIRGNNMAIAALEGAIWDLWCRQNDLSLSTALGGTRREIEVGVSIGIEPTPGQLVESVEAFVAQGYKRMKIKIKPGYDIRFLEAVRNRFGMELPLMADANSAYTLRDLPLLRELDSLGLMMIEQPLAYDDIIDHARLQEALKTPICLDESIHSLEDARKAVEMKSCTIINIKIGRVGGLFEARRIHDWCAKEGVPVWCGGMMELGVGRAHNIALASLPNFTLPGDTSASHRSFNRDIVFPAIDFIRPGVLQVPDGPGFGYELDMKAVKDFTVRQETFCPELLAIA